MAETRTVRLCVIGAGKHARNNVFPSLYRLEGVEIVAVCDIDVDAARRVADTYRIPGVYSSHLELIEREKPDAAIVCTGPAGHYAIAMDLLDAGVHVYTEKPTAPSLDDGLRMLAAAEANDRICMTAFKKRFAPAYVKAKQLIDSEPFGERGGMNVIRTSRRNGGTDTASRRRMLDWACHLFDVSYYFWGPVRRVTTTRSAAEDQCAWSVVLEHDDGAFSHQFLAFYPEYHKESVYLCGSGGIDIQIENSINMVARKAGKVIDEHIPSFTNGVSFSDVEQGFSGELIEFVSAVRDGRTPEGNIRQACHTLAIFEAFWEGAESGRPVEVAFR